MGRKPGESKGSPAWRERVGRGTQRGHQLRRKRLRVTLREIRSFRQDGLVAESLLPFVEAAQVEAHELLNDLGGEENVSTQERLLAEDLARLGVALRGELAFYVRTGDHHAAGRIATLVGARRASLQALGLSRRQREIDLAGYLQAKAGEEGD